MGQLEMVGEGEGTAGRREHDSAREQGAGRCTGQAGVQGLYTQEEQGH